MQEAAERILITGANGFVGRHLIAHLLEASEMTREGGALRPQIFAAVRPEDLPAVTQALEQPFGTAGWAGGEVAGQIEVVGLNINDPAATTALFQRLRPNQVYHLAARSSGADGDREAVLAVNVGGTRHLLEAASGLHPFPRVLLVSTGYVYGNTDPARPAREEDPIGPLWRYGPYTDSKIEMESVARSYRGFALVARAFAHTGPGQTPTFATPAFARQLARIERGLEPPELRVGNLTAQRDLLDVRDVVRAYRLLMEQGIPGDVYNVATGKPTPIGDVLDRLRELCSVPTSVSVDPSRLRPADISCSTGDPLRLWAAVNWQPRYSLETTLRDTLDYWRKVSFASVG